MKTVGIVVEYNPFHNGHYYHIQKTKKESGADVLIAVMSGYFLQRGEPALISKWERTKMALQGGADLVIEIPYAFSTQRAEVFANGAISLLHEVGAEQVWFGSESGTLSDFEEQLNLLYEHREPFERQVKQYLALGNSYPKALSLAYDTIETHNKQKLDVSQPNNILGFHYLKAIKEQHINMKAKTILRTQAHYHDTSISHKSIASATSIRKKLLENNATLTAVQPVIPTFAFDHLERYLNKYGLFHHWEQYFPFLKYRLLSMTPQQLQTIYEAEEGLEYRFSKQIIEATNFQDFMHRVKTKRYTWNRLQRFCLHIFTNTTKHDMKSMPASMQAPYIRLLGMSQTGQSYMNRIKKQLSIPLVSTLSQHQHPLLELDKKAAACYTLAYPPAIQTQMMKREYSTPPIRYNENSKCFLR